MSSSFFGLDFLTTSTSSGPTALIKLPSARLRVREVPSPETFVTGYVFPLYFTEFPTSIPYSSAVGCFSSFFFLVGFSSSSILPYFSVHCLYVGCEINRTRF